MLHLAIFDLDGTLKQARDPYVYLHTHLGTLEANNAFLQDGMAGKISYEEWLRLDAELWKGVSLARIQDLFRQNPYLPGAVETVRALKAAGLKLALVSTGIQIHADMVAAELGFDDVIANHVFIRDGVVSGEVRVGVPEGHKGQVAERLMQMFGASPAETLAVGDTRSDADLFERAGVSVAVCPNDDAVRRYATLVLEQPDLTPVVPWLTAHGYLQAR